VRTAIRTLGRRLLTTTLTAAVTLGVAALPAQAATPQWESLGLPGGFNIKVAKNADGRLEVFAETAQSSAFVLWHRTQSVDGWGEWLRLGPAGHAYAVAQEADGRLRVFTTPNTTVQSIAQTTANGAWGSWENTAVPSSEYDDGVAAVLDPWGRLHLFTGTGRHIYRRDERRPGGLWDTPKDLSFEARGYTAYTVAVNAGGAPELFVAVYGDPRIWRSRQQFDGTWSAWNMLAPHPTGGQFTRLQVLRQADGRLGLYGTDSTSALLAASQDGPDGGWSGTWSRATTPGTNRFPTVSFGQNPDGSTERFVASYEVDELGAHLYRQQQNAPGTDTWGPAVDLRVDPAQVTLQAGPVASITDTDGRMWLLATAESGIVYQRQSTPGTW
jgi:hypothetical protein